MKDKIDVAHFEAWLIDCLAIEAGLIDCFPPKTQGVSSDKMADYIISYLNNVMGWKGDFVFECTTNRLLSPPDIPDLEGFCKVCLRLGIEPRVIES